MTDASRLLQSLRRHPWWLVLFPLAYGIAALLLGQDTGWDLQNYHLYNPYALLNGRLDHDLAPAGLQTYFNPLLDLARYGLTQVASPATSTFLVACLHGLNAVLLYFIIKRVLKAEAAPAYLLLPLLLAGALSLTLLAEVGTSSHDALVSLFPLVALSLILRSQEQPVSSSIPKSILLAGVLGGIGCGLKLTVATNTLALCLALLCQPQSFGHNFRQAFAFGMAVVAGLMLSYGYWAYVLWHEFGNPLFPMFNSVFQAPLAEPVSGRDMRFVPQTLNEWLFYPWSFTMNPWRVSEFPYRQAIWLPAYVLTLFYLYRRCHLRLGHTKIEQSLASGSRVTRITEHLDAPAVRDSRLTMTGFFVLCYCGFSYLLWLYLFGIYRYLTPLEPLLPLLVVIICVKLWPRRHAANMTMLAISLITAWQISGITVWARSDWSQHYFQVEKPSALRDESAVVLMGQPLAWVIPALNTQARFIQADPNFAASEIYLEKAMAMLAASEDIYLIQDPTITDPARVQRHLAMARLSIANGSCEPLQAYLGSQVFNYEFCMLTRD